MSVAKILRTKLNSTGYSFTLSWFKNLLTSSLRHQSPKIIPYHGSQTSRFHTTCQSYAQITPSNSSNTYKNPSTKDNTALSPKITATTIRLISVEGKLIGVVNIKDALSQFDSRTHQLIQVDGRQDPPICKIVEKQKKVSEKEKSSQKPIKRMVTKELEIKTVIDTHDYEIKLTKAREFFRKGFRVQFNIVYKRNGVPSRVIVQRLLDDLKSDADVISPPSERKVFTVLFGPKVTKIQKDKRMDKDKKEKENEKDEKKSRNQ